MYWQSKNWLDPYNSSISGGLIGEECEGEGVGLHTMETAYRYTFSHLFIVVGFFSLGQNSE